MTTEEYWKKRCELAEAYIEESPCDPDIYPEQIKAYDAWQEFKKLVTPAVSKSEGLQGRELLLAYTQWLSERDNVDTYWLDDSDVDNFLSKQ